jgi:telomerase reverse transcriptase
LSSKLCHYIRPKLIPVLLDEETNSPLTVRINVYQTFLLGAMKLHCFMHRLPCPPDATRSSQWILSAIETAIRYAIESTRARRVARQTGHSKAIMCNPSLPHSHVEFLAFHAFYTIIQKKQSQYKDLLDQLKDRLNQPKCKRCAPHLKEAIDPKHSSVFDSILY